MIEFIEESRRFLTQNFLPKIERCVELLADEDIWYRPNESSNSIGNLLLHLNGNVRQWIVSGIGGAEDVRRRQEEFDARHLLPKEELLRRLKSTLEEADSVLAALPAENLLQKRLIQGHEVTSLYAIYHVVEHFSMHTGQIIMLAKARLARDLSFYEMTDGVPKKLW